MNELHEQIRNNCSLSIGYIATDRVVIESKWYTEFRNGPGSPLHDPQMGNITWHTKITAVGDTGVLNGLKREELAILDLIVLTRSSLFAGIGVSTFSKQIVHDRARISRSAPSYLLDAHAPAGCQGLDL
jgi:hypothetical protein